MPTASSHATDRVLLTQILTGIGLMSSAAALLVAGVLLLGYDYSTACRRLTKQGTPCDTSWRAIPAFQAEMAHRIRP
jgi:hypothetical protein